MMDSVNRRILFQTLAGGILLARTGKSAGIPTALISPQSGRLSSESFGDLRVYMEGNTEQLKSLAVGSLELKPGQSPHPPHSHPEEEIMLITAGHGEISIEGKAAKVGPGTLMYAGANRVHGIVNTSDAPLTFYYFKWIGA